MRANKVASAFDANVMGAYCLLATVAALCSVTPAFAGVAVPDPNASKASFAAVKPVPQAAVAAPMAPPPQSKHARNNATVDDIDLTAAPGRAKKALRCWQHGQLILERSVDDPPANAGTIVSLSAGKAVAAGAASGSDIRLFDLRNAFCLLQ